MNKIKFDTVDFGRLLTRLPDGIARLRGGPDYPAIEGWVRFYDTPYGCLLAVEAWGLPHHEGACESHFFGLHIHEGGHCAGGGGEEPFADTGAHYNPNQCRHPQHAGDLPPLMEKEGRGFLATIAGGLTVSKILGRSVVLHTDPDDFHTQPSGNAGKKMACGVILPVRRS